MRLRRIVSASLLLALVVPACRAPNEAPGVHASPEAVQPLQPGSAVPSASIRSVDGEPLDLASLVSERGAMLVFYRGGW